MKVDAVSLQTAHSVRFEAIHHMQHKVKELKQGQSYKADLSESSPVPTEESDQNVKDSENNRGVLRLLQDGHFKGVADVRLRINFYDEISAIEHKELQAVVEEKITGILESVEEEIGKFLGGDVLTEEQSASVTELKKVFLQDVIRIKDEFMNSEAPSKEALLETLNSTFEEFIASLTSVQMITRSAAQDDVTAADDVVEESVSVSPANEDGDVVQEPVSSPESKDTLQSFLEDLKAAFSKTLRELTNKVNEINILPELSKPKGNGVAYDRFLTMYNQLRGVETQIAEPPNDDPLDTIV